MLAPFATQHSLYSLADQDLHRANSQHQVHGNQLHPTQQDLQHLAPCIPRRNVESFARPQPHVARPIGTTAVLGLRCRPISAQIQSTKQMPSANCSLHMHNKQPPFTSAKAKCQPHLAQYTKLIAPAHHSESCTQPQCNPARPAICTPPLAPTCIL